MIFIIIAIILILCIASVWGFILIGRNTWEDFEEEDNLHTYLKDNAKNN